MQMGKRNLNNGLAESAIIWKWRILKESKERSKYKAHKSWNIMLCEWMEKKEKKKKEKLSKVWDQHFGLV